MTNVFFTVQISCMLNDILAIVEIHINIKVGHTYTFRIQKSFKKQFKPERINVGNCHGISNKGTGSRTTPWTNWFVMFFCPVNKFPYNQKVTGKPHAKNNIHFVFSTFSNFWSNFAVAFYKPSFYNVPNIIILICLIIISVSLEFFWKFKSRQTFFKLRN